MFSNKALSDLEKKNFDLELDLHLAKEAVEVYKAKYESLCSGIVDERAIKAAEAMVSSAFVIARTNRVPLRQVWTMMMEHMYGTGAIRRKPGSAKRRYEKRERRKKRV